LAYACWLACLLAGLLACWPLAGLLASWLAGLLAGWLGWASWLAPISTNNQKTYDKTKKINKTKEKHQK